MGFWGWRHRTNGCHNLWRYLLSAAWHHIGGNLAIFALHVSAGGAVSMVTGMASAGTWMNVSGGDMQAGSSGTGMDSGYFVRVA